MSGFKTRFGRSVMTLAAVLMLLASSALADQHVLGIDDVLSMEAFGDVSIDPGGDWLVYERRGRFDSAPRYDLGHRSVWAITDLFVVDLNGRGPPRRLLPAEQGVGLVLGSWSPSGQRLLVYRLAGDRLEAGVVDPARQEVFWTGLTPDLPQTGSGAEWRDDDRLILSTRPDGTLPWSLARDGASQAETGRLWRTAADGERPSATVIDTQGGKASTTAPVRKQRLIELDARRRSARVLAEDRVLDVAVSPDGARVALLVAGEPIAITTGAVRAYDMQARIRLRMLNADTGALIAQPEADVALHLLRWSTTSDAVLVWSRNDGEAWSSGGLRSLGRDGATTVFPQGDLAAMPEGVIIDELRGVQADWFDGAPVLRGRKGTGRFDWYRLQSGAPPRVLTADLPGPVGGLAAVSEKGLMLFSGGGLWEVTRAAVRRLSPVGVQVVDAVSTSAMQPLRLRLNATPRRDWVLGRLPTGRVQVYGPHGPAAHFDLAIPTGGSILAAASDRVVAPLIRNQGAETLLLDTTSGALPIDAVNADFGSYRFFRPVPITHQDRNGRQTRSWLTLPDGQGDGRVRGLVVAVYPGSSGEDTWLDPRVLLYGVRPHFFAAAGYAVLTPSLPAEAAEDATPEHLVESVDLAVDAALRDFPVLPADRIAVMGHSFGGTAALSIATRTPRYQSYIAWSAGTDFAGKWGEFEPVSRVLPGEGLSVQGQMGWVETGQGAMGGPPWSAADRYAAFSPYAAADRIRSPVLLITGDRDFVPMSQSERMFTALHRQGVEARLVTYWGEGHFNWSPANIRDLYAQILNWLDQTLPPFATVSITGTNALPRPGPTIPASPRS